MILGLLIAAASLIFFLVLRYRQQHRQRALNDNDEHQNSHQVSAAAQENNREISDNIPSADQAELLTNCPSEKTPRATTEDPPVDKNGDNSCSSDDGADEEQITENPACNLGEMSSQGQLSGPSDQEETATYNLSKSSFSGSLVCRADSVVQNITQDCPRVRISSSELDQLKSDSRERERWSRMIDVLAEDKRFMSLDTTDLLSRLTDLSQEDRDLVNDCMDRLVTILRWRPKLEKGLRKALQSLDYGELPDPKGYLISVDRLRETRFRLALCELNVMDINSLDPETVTALADTGCLSYGEYNQVMKGDGTLTDYLSQQHEDSFRMILCVFERRCPQLIYSLLQKFLDVDISKDTFYRRQVPPLRANHVKRESYSQLVRQWMIKHCKVNDNPTVLILHGLGSIGKSSIIIEAAGQALDCGYHLVLWIDAANQKTINILRTLALRLLGNERTELSEEELKAELHTRMNEFRKKKDRILVIMDDVHSASVLNCAAQIGPILCTSRIRDVGKRSSIDDKEDIDIEPFTAEESSRLLEYVLGRDVFGELQSKEGMLEKVAKMCADNSQMPLTVNIIGSIMKRDHIEWKNTGLPYLNQLDDHLTEARGNIEAMSEQIDTSYKYKNVYAAIIVSIKRLSDSDRDKFYDLAVFERGEKFRPRTLVKFWKVNNEWKVKEKLGQFVGESILIEAGPNEYVLHDLLADILQAHTNEEKLMELRKTLVRCFGDSESLAPWKGYSATAIGDSFAFQSRFINLALSAGMNDFAESYLSNLRYHMTRISMGLTHGLIADFKNVSSCFSEGETRERLCAFEDTVQATLPVVSVWQDQDVLLRTALMRRHDDIVFMKARYLVQEDFPDGVFFKSHTSPAVVENLLISKHFPMDYEKGNIIDIDVDNRNRHVLIATSQQYVKLHDWSGQFRTLAEIRLESKVHLVRFLSVSPGMCLLVTESEAFIVKVQKADFGASTPMTFNLPKDMKVKYPCICRDAAFEHQWLWILTDSSLVCYSISTSGFQEYHTFSQNNQHGKIVTIEKGCRAIVSPSCWLNFNPIMYSIKSKESRQLDGIKGQVRAALPGSKCFIVVQRTGGERKMLSLVDTEMGGMVKQTRVIASTHGDEVICVMERSFVLMNKTSFSCTRYHFDGQPYQHFQLSRWHNTVSDSQQLPSDLYTNDLVFYRCKNLFVRPHDNCQLGLIVYSLENETEMPSAIRLLDSVSSKPVSNRRSERLVLSVEWAQKLDDFIVAVCDKSKFQLEVYRLRTSHKILTHPVSDPWYLLISTSSLSIAVAVSGSSNVKTFSVGTGDLLHNINFEVDCHVEGVYHSLTGDEDLYVTIRKGHSSEFLKIDNSGESKTLFLINDFVKSIRVSAQNDSVIIKHGVEDFLTLRSISDGAIRKDWMNVDFHECSHDVGRLCLLIKDHPSAPPNVEMWDVTETVKLFTLSGVYVQYFTFSPGSLKLLFLEGTHDDICDVFSCQLNVWDDPQSPRFCPVDLKHWNTDTPIAAYGDTVLCLSDRRRIVATNLNDGKRKLLLDLGWTGGDWEYAGAKWLYFSVNPCRYLVIVDNAENVVAYDMISEILD